MIIRTSSVKSVDVHAKATKRNTNNGIRLFNQLLQLMSLSVLSYTNAEAMAFLPELAKLRIEVFREYPYLYEGNLEYELAYLASFVHTSEVVLVVAFDGKNVVGVSTGMPLSGQPDEVQQPWMAAEQPISDVFYLSESVLKKEWRGQGIGVRFFEERERWARHLGFSYAAFCAVIRPADDPWKPEGYVPLDAFWQHRGYQRMEGYVCQMRWQMIYETAETNKALQFWRKDLRLDYP